MKKKLRVLITFEWLQSECVYIILTSLLAWREQQVPKYVIFSSKSLLVQSGNDKFSALIRGLRDKVYGWLFVIKEHDLQF